MTNLFYPSLAIYLLKRNPPVTTQAYHAQHFPENHIGPARASEKDPYHPLSLLDKPLRDTFFPYPATSIPRLAWAGWWAGGTDVLDAGAVENHWLASKVSRAQRLGGIEDEEILMMRMSWGDVGQLTGGGREENWSERDAEIVAAYRRIAEDWDKQWPSEGCLRDPRSSAALEDMNIGSCILVSNGLALNGVLPIQDLGVSADNSTLYQVEGQQRSIAALIRIPHQSKDIFLERWAKAVDHIASLVGAAATVEPQGWRGRVADRAGEFRLSVSLSTTLIGKLLSSR